MKGQDKSREQLLEEMGRVLEELDACRSVSEEAQKKYESLLESIPDAMFFVNRLGTIVRVNEQVEALFGYSSQELVGQSVEILVPDRFRQVHGDHVKEFFIHPRARHMGGSLTIYGVRKDGTEFPADVSLSALWLDGDRCAAAAVRDITDLKRSEEQIRKSYQMQQVMCAILKSSLESVPLEKELQRILDQILAVPWLSLQGKGAIFTVEGDPEVLVMKAEKKFRNGGESQCERVSLGHCLCGRAVLSNKVSYVGVVDEAHQQSSAEKSCHGHYCVPIVYNDRPIGLVNVLVPEGHQRNSEEENFLVAIANTAAGIIERHRTQREKEKLLEQLAESEKLAALGRLTQNVAHEIRNPLTAVGGFARRLKKAMEEGIQGKEYVDLILEDVRRLETTLKNVLTLSSTEPLNRSRQDIHKTIDRVLSRYQGSCHDHSVIIEKRYGDLPPLLMDGARVEQAVDSLVASAVQSMKGGGRLTILTQETRVQEKPFVRIGIGDTGKGITEEKKAMIFEPFFSPGESSGAVDPGVPISKKIVEAHGGFIKVEGRPGEGTTFCLYFPL